VSLLDQLCIGAAVFDALPDMLRVLGEIAPNVIVVDITVGGSGDIAMIDQFVAAGAKCPIQILSGLNPVLIEQVRRHGERSGLRMLPVISKPLKGGSIRQV